MGGSPSRFFQSTRVFSQSWGRVSNSISPTNEILTTALPVLNNESLCLMDTRVDSCNETIGADITHSHLPDIIRTHALGAEKLLKDQHGTHESLSDEQLEFAQILNSRLEEVALAREAYVVARPETDHDDVEVRNEVSNNVVPKLRFPSSILTAANKMSKKIKKKKKLKLDRNVEAHLPRSFYKIPVYAPGSPYRERDPFSPLRPSSPTIIEEYSDHHEILEILRVKPSDEEVEEETKAMKKALYKQIRAQIASFHLQRQGDLAFALGHLTKVSEDINVILGRTDDSDCNFGDEVSFDDKRSWKTESPREVRSVLSMLKTRSEPCDDLDKCKAELLKMHQHDRESLRCTDSKSVMGELLCLAPATNETMVESHNENDYDIHGGITISPLSLELDSVDMLPYSPTQKPFYSPPGYLEFVNENFDGLKIDPDTVLVNAFVDGAELEDLIAGLPDNSIPIFTRSPTRHASKYEAFHRLSPVIKLPTSKIWNSQPYCRNLVSFLEGKTWPYSRKVDVIWDFLECEMIFELADQELVEAIEEARLAAEAELNKRTTVSGALFGALGKGFSSVGKGLSSAASRLKSASKKLMTLGSMFGGIGSKNSSTVDVELQNDADPKPALDADHNDSAPNEYHRKAESVPPSTHSESLSDSRDDAASSRRRRLLDFGPLDYEDLE